MHPLNCKFWYYAFGVDFQEVYIADSESSSIRTLDLKTGGSKLLAGGDPLIPENLFRVLLSITWHSDNSCYKI